MKTVHGIMRKLLNQNRENIRMKMGSGAYGVYFDCDNKRMSIDFSGNSSFMGESPHCYRNDSTVLLFVAHSYKQSFLVIEQQLMSSFEDKNEKEAKHLMMPYYFLFRHYCELELKSFLIGVTGANPPAIHDLKKLCKSFQKKIKALVFDKDVAGATNYIEFNAHKDTVHKSLILIREELRAFKSFEPADEYFRFLYSNDFELKASKIDFDYNFQTVLFHKIVELFSSIEDHMWYLVRFNALMGG